MDPFTIAGSVVAFLTPLLVKASEAFASEGGKKAFSAAQGLLDRIRGKDRAAQAPAPVPAEAVEAFQADPVGGAGPFTAVLAAALQKDPSYLAEVAAALDVARATVTVEQDLVDVQRATGLRAGSAEGLNAHVTQRAERVDEVVGAEIGLPPVAPAERPAPRPGG